MQLIIKNPLQRCSHKSYDERAKSNEKNLVDVMDKLIKQHTLTSDNDVRENLQIQDKPKVKQGGTMNFYSPIKKNKPKTFKL